MDFFTVPTAGFRVLYALFVVHHDRRRLLHLGVAEHPTAEWIIAQLREAFPFGTAPRYLLFDGDRKFRGRVETAIRNMSIEPKRTAYRSPWQNGVAERLVGSIRRKLIDHVVVANENHLRRLLREYQTYYSQGRCHLALGKDAPVARPIEYRPSPSAKVTALPRVGGIHHRYVLEGKGSQSRVGGACFYFGEAHPAFTRGSTAIRLSIAPEAPPSIFDWCTAPKGNSADSQRLPTAPIRR